MKDVGKYEILSHVAMPDCSIRIIRINELEQVSPHYHEKSAQIYTVLENEVEAQVGERTFRLRPFETVRIDQGIVHSLRPLRGAALILSLAIPPLDRNDQQPAE